MVQAIFLFLLFIFPLGQLARIELGGGLNILLNDVVVGIIVLFWCISKIPQGMDFSNTKITKPILIFALIAAMSLLINSRSLNLPEFAVAGLYLLRWVAYAGIYFVVHDFPEKVKEKIPLWLLSAGTATALLGLVQYVLYPNLRNLFYAGWDEHLYRLFSTFYDPNFAGGVLVLTFLLGLTMFLKSSLARGRLARLIFLWATIMSVVALLLTYSRGSFLSFIAGVIIYLWLIDRRKLIILSLFIFVCGIYLLPKDLQGEGVRLFRTASIESRLEEAQHAIVIFQENPIFGVGFNAYRYAKENRNLTTVNEFGDIHSAAGTDNSFLFVLATTGIIGIAGYLYLWLTIMRMFIKIPVVVASLCAIFVHALFVNSLFYPHIMEWLWILLAAVKVRK